jgi:hypothetical protein
MSQPTRSVILSRTSRNPLGIEEDASEVASEGPMRTSLYKAFCAGAMLIVNINILECLLHRFTPLQ